MNHIKHFNGFLNESYNKGYKITDKVTLEAIKKAASQQIKEFLNGNTSIDDFYEFIDNYGMESLNDIKELESAKNLVAAVKLINKELLKTKQIDEEDYESLDGGLEGLETSIAMAKKSKPYSFKK